MAEERKWKVLLMGEDFLIEFDVGVQPCGFYASRFVVANTPEEAERAAIELLRDDEDLIGVVRNGPGDAEPRLFAPSITELPDFGDVQVPGAGFTFFRARRDP